MGIFGGLTAQNLDWKKIDKLLENRQFTTAMSELTNRRAALSGMDRLHATVMMAHAASGYMEDWEDSTLMWLHEDMPALSEKEQAVGHLLLAQFYQEYYEQHRWAIRNNSATDETDLDYKLWDEERYKEAVSRELGLALQNSALKAMGSDEYDWLVEKGTSLWMTPTLWDIVVRYGLDHGAKDVPGWKDLLDFHKDGEPRLRLDLEVHCLDKKDTARIKQLIAQYRHEKDCGQVAQLYHLLAMAEQSKPKAVEWCDSALALGYKDSYTSDCENLKAILLQHQLKGTYQNVLMSGVKDYAQIHTTNIGHVWMRIMKKVDLGNRNENAILSLLKSQPVLKAWDSETECRGDHEETSNLVELPAMPQGDYIVLVSESKTFDKNAAWTYLEYKCCDVALIQEEDKGAKGRLVWRKSGLPVANLKVSVEQWHSWKEVKEETFETTTDKEGWFETPVQSTSYHRYYFVCSEGGYTYRTQLESVRTYVDATNERKVKTVRIFTDKPVYRLGEKVEWSLVSYEGTKSDWSAKSMELNLMLRDPNGEIVDSVKVASDSMGEAHGAFRLPASGLNGYYHLAPDGFNSKAIKVEAYKQPKFMVSLPSDNESHNLGDEVKVGGMAASYSQVPISGAEVRWSVRRSEQRPWWRWYTDSWTEDDGTGSYDGTTTTDGEGRFEFVFPALPNANRDSSWKGYYLYQIEAVVTDLNGETHSSTRTICIGRENRVIEIRSLTPEKLQLNLTNLEHNPVKGCLHAEIWKVPVRKKAELRHPYLPSDKDDLKKNAEKVFEGEARCEGNGPVTLDLDRLPSGQYWVKVHTADNEPQVENVNEVLIVLPGEKIPQTDDLLWSEAPVWKEVGDTAVLRIGSRYRGVSVYYTISTGEKVLERGSLVLDNEIQELRIPVTEQCLGGMSVTMAVMKENQHKEESYEILVPYTHKRIEMKLVTFRDKIEPGSHERWTLKLGTPEWDGHKSQTANVLLTMYDEALTEFGRLDWDLSPWSQWKVQMYSYSNNLTSLNAYAYGPLAKTISIPNNESPYGLRPLLSRGYGSRMLYKGAYAANKMVTMEVVSDEVSNDEIARRPLAAARGENGMIAISTADEGVTDIEATVVTDLSIEEESAKMETSAESSDEDIQMRTDLSTTAFFMPALRSNEEGELEFEFTAPDLLTSWNLHGLSWTQDMKIGSMLQKIVTQKELMVTPNVPRFLRHGDQVDFMVKVSNMGEEQPVKVSLELSDAATGRVFAQPTSQTLTLAEKESQAVTFSFEVPDDVYVATYRVIAEGSRSSDGEQAQIPVLSNRQMVTQSLSMYLNGSGEKHYRMKNFVGTPHSLTVEYTSNPIWYAVQSIPYLEEHKSPSMIYLANTLYAGVLGREILSHYPEAEAMFAQWEKEEPDAFLSNLEKNEELKQTVLRETPWVRQAKAENQQHRQVAQYFNKEKLQAELQQNRAKLLSQQRSNGGWSWMPDGRWDDEYTTQYILTLAGQARKNGISLDAEVTAAMKRAVKYVDKKEQEYYEKYIKKEKVRFSATDINYLYMRSLWEDVEFSGRSREVYSYYYKNALKDYNDYDNLYTRAQMALIFHRHGDQKTAKKMIHALKECALYSDEMGMYWRDNVNSWWWYQRPIETQAMLIEALDEVAGDPASVGKMQQWLLKQKQTTHWGSDVATTQAVTALLHHGRLTLTEENVEVSVGGKPLEAQAQSGTGYVRQQWSGDEITPEMAEVTLKAANKESISWGAMYYQYFEDLDKIPYNEMGIKLQKDLFRIEQDGTLTQVKTLKVGDRVRVRILIDCDRNLEFLELKDQRAGAFEPASTQSGWNWNNGLSYYADIHDASSSFFIDHMEKGKYVLEYTLIVNASGDYSNGICTMQCMYAPEFRANTEGFRITIEK